MLCLIPAVTVPPRHGRAWADGSLAVGRVQHPLPALVPAFALQDALPVIGPGAQAAAWGWQLDVPVVAAGEQDVLPARVRFCPCGKGGKAGISWGVAPQPAASCGNAVQTLDGVLVIKQQVSSHHGLVSGQNNPLHKLGSQVFLYPLILQRQGTAENPTVLFADHSCQTSPNREISSPCKPSSVSRNPHVETGCGPGC